MSKFISSQCVLLNLGLQIDPEEERKFSFRVYSRSTGASYEAKTKNDCPAEGRNPSCRTLNLRQTIVCYERAGSAHTASVEARITFAVKSFSAVAREVYRAIRKRKGGGARVDLAGADENVSQRIDPHALLSGRGQWPAVRVDEEILGIRQETSHG